MEHANKLLDKFLETCSPKQDKEVAHRLHVTKSAVSNWRNGRSYPEADSIETMAIAIGEPVGPWLAAIEAERARTPNVRRVWLRFAQTLGGVVGVAILVTTRMSIM